MGHVESKDVHTAVDQPGDHFRRVSGGSEGRNDFLFSSFGWIKRFLFGSGGPPFLGAEDVCFEIDLFFESVHAIDFHLQPIAHADGFVGPASCQLALCSWPNVVIIARAGTMERTRSSPNPARPQKIRKETNFCHERCVGDWICGLELGRKKAKS